MRNSILIGVMLSCAIFGGIIGGAIKGNQDQSALEQAWSNVTIVANGTLVPDPAYYAEHPEELASDNKVWIVSNNDAAIHEASTTVCTDRSGNTFINPKDDECRDWKTIQHI